MKGPFRDGWTMLRNDTNIFRLLAIAHVRNTQTLCPILFFKIYMDLNDSRLVPTVHPELPAIRSESMRKLKHLACGA